MIKIKAFTLLELMFVLVIVAIITLFSLPRYTEYIAKGHRSDGVSMLHKVLNEEERFFAKYSHYTADFKELGMAESIISSEREYYLIKGQACSNASSLDICIELLAEAQGQQKIDGNLVFDSSGRQVRIKDGVEYALK